jgi:cell division protein FtsQ
VRRELPRRLVIDVVERAPMALVALDRLYYVDRRGVIFAALGDDDPLDLPLITGLDAGDAGRRRALREALKVLHLVEVEGLSFRVSEVHIQEEQGVRLFPVEPALALTFGWGGAREKVSRLETVLASLAGRERRIREIDLTFRDEAVVRFKRT